MALRTAHRLVLALLPTAVVRLLARAHQPLARSLAALRFRRRHGGRLIAKIDAEDDLLQWSLDAMSAEPSFRYFRAVESYFDGGERNVAEIGHVLEEVGCSLRDVDSMLEFACGSGRLTRHFVRRMSPATITVSDVDRRAVDFVTRTFGVRGFYSTGEPEQLIHDDLYQLIVVASLFSHLPLRNWTRWLKRLETMLQPSGLLLFSTLLWDTGGAPVPDEQKEALELGFLYSQRNETRGRLRGEEYGTAFVSHGFVTSAVSEHLTGSLLRYSPGALNGVQDVYVFQRAAQGVGLEVAC